ncbi:MAG: hybrid sensor histidine kinase/response regulator [Planctomycetota bacterium]|jgi:two-component system chemotaxis sensor kinase CheA
MDNSEILGEFLAEAKEHLSDVEGDILRLEKDGAEIDAETVNHLFRAVHTVKGGAGFLELESIISLSHELESVVGLIRSKKLIPDQTVCDSLLKGIDLLANLVDDPYGTDIDISESMKALQNILSGDSNPAADKNNDTSKEAVAEETEPSSVEIDIESIKNKGQNLWKFVIDLAADDIRGTYTPEDIITDLNALGIIISSVPSVDKILEIDPSLVENSSVEIMFASVIDEPSMVEVALGFKPVSAEKLTLDEFADLQNEGQNADEDSSPSNLPDKKRTVSLEKTAQSPVSGSAGRKADTKLKVSVSLLDKLMNLASELVLVRNQNMQAVENIDLKKISDISQRLNVVTSELQASVMQTRMQSVSNVFNRFNRIVRELAKTLNKEISLHIEGSDVELDKNIIDAIGDPLTHLIRNSVDHGIEPPEYREKHGKDRLGRVFLRAFHENGQVKIQISDDGKGMDPEKLKQSALGKGLITQSSYDHMSDEDAFGLIFTPGFSSAEKVTDISGRGVGMDVVKSAFQRLGGVVDVNSKKGSGTTITITLPLTLAILPGLVVDVESYCFAIPQSNIVEVVWLYGADVFQKIEKVDNQEVYWLRGKFLPVMRLSKILDLKRTYVNPESGVQEDDRRTQYADRRKGEDPLNSERRDGPSDRRSSIQNSIYIVVLRLGAEHFGLIVDDIIDTEEIVVKPLHEQLKDCLAFAGTSVMGDGRVAMILDIPAIANLGDLNVINIDSGIEKVQHSSHDSYPVLLFDIGKSENFAVPLFIINRVERIKKSSIHVASGKEFFSFRDQLAPLIRLEDAGVIESADYGEDLYVLIPNCDRPVGILASNILDTFELQSDVDSKTITHSGVMGSSLIDDKLTLFLDVYTIINASLPDWLSVAGEHLAKDERLNILLLEDSPFHSMVIESYLTGLGFEFVHVNNGREGIEKLSEVKFDIIVSDLEMPHMNGFQFAQWIRSNPEYRELPMLAITSSENPNFREMAFDSGFDAFHSKLDREGILDALNNMSQVLAT